MKNNPNKKMNPRFRNGQLVLAPINNVGEKVLCQVRSIEWKNDKKTWVYVCVTENGHHLLTIESELESVGPKPVNGDLLHVVQVQEDALAAGIITALNEALEEFDANGLSVTVDGCTYDGITRGEDGDLMTTVDGSMPMRLSKVGITALISIYHAYVRRSLLPI